MIGVGASHGEHEDFFSKILPADSLGLTIEDEDEKRFMGRFRDGISPGFNVALQS